MANLFCDNCGADIQETAKFCRRCGQPANMWEATTRTLETPPEAEAGTRPIAPAPTAPSYMPPTAYSPHQVQSTNSFERRGGVNKIILILGAMVMALLLALGLTVAFLTMNEDSEPAVAPPVVSIPAPPNPPARPDAPQPPPPPPLPGGATALDQTLIYPDAEVIMNMSQRDGGGVTQLRTSDPVDKVAAWYEQRVAVTKRVNIPGGNVVLRWNEGTVIITGAGGQTSIVIKHGAD